MNYLIVADNIITNIIVCADDATAASFGAVPSYDGARIGDTYAPPPPPEPEPTLADRVDELDEALNMILTGYTGEEAADEAGTAE